MIFNLSAAGYLPDDNERYQQIDELIRQITEFLSETEKYGTPQINMLISPEYSGGCWEIQAKRNELPIHGYALLSESEKLMDCVRTVHIDSSIRSVIGESLCNQADLLLLVWNEDVLEMNGATWELIQSAQRIKTPCIWISSKTGEIYWTEESCFKPYQTDYLKELCRNMKADVITATIHDKNKSFLISLGAYLNNRFLRKHKAQSSVMNAEKDVLLTDDFNEIGNAADEKLRKNMLDKFKQFDSAAIEYASRYHAVMYWRAILPFITTIFLGIGFYIGAIFKLLPYGRAALMGKADIIAGVGFLMHGLSKLYVYILSKDDRIKRSHSKFINTRYTAEMLRVLIHFVPYGISVNLRKLSRGNQNVYATIRNFINEADCGSLEINKENIDVILKHITEMVEDQINYHRVSKERYKLIVEKLDKWYKWIFSFGFISIILRAILQFIMGVKPLNFAVGGIVFDNSLISPLANMVALMLPAWADFFSSKMVQCNYQYNYENHKRMEKNLTGELKRLQYINKLESPVFIEALTAIAENLAQTMLESDTGTWYSKMQASDVKQL